MRREIRPPGQKDPIVIDSADPAQQAELAAFLNKPVVRVKVDALGKLVAAESLTGDAGGTARLQADLPFRLTLPDQPPAANQAWERPFAVKLDPPHGTGESYDAVQKYTYKGVAQSLAVIGVSTALKAAPATATISGAQNAAPAPATAAEQVPLVPMLWEGDVYFHPATGRYYAARLRVKKELLNHQGEGTKFVYESTYLEDAVEGK
jgi:hypothetical protein